MYFRERRALGELVNISIILAFRDKAPTYVDSGKVYGVGIRDLVSSWPHPIAFLPKIEASPEIEKDCLREGDILMPARGTAYPARYFNDQDGIVFPIGQIYVLRTRQKSLSRYLVWYLNRPGCQQELRSSISGTTVMSLKKSSLSDIQIELPDIDTQNRIARFQELGDHRALLQAELAAVQAAELEAACELVFEGKK